MNWGSPRGRSTTASGAKTGSSPSTSVAATRDGRRTCEAQPKPWVELKEKLLAVFEAYEEWLVGEDFRGCAFANAAAEIPNPDHPARVVARRHKEGIEEHLAALAKEAGFDESRTLAKRLLLLLEGAAATAAMRRSREPIGVARSRARELLDVRPR